MTGIEQKNIETEKSWWAAEITDYSKILWWAKVKTWDEETAKEKKFYLRKKIEPKTEEEKKIPTTTSENKHEKQRSDGQTRKENNPGEVNVKRFDAGKNIINEINAPQTNIIAKGLQRIVKKIWWV